MKTMFFACTLAIVMVSTINAQEKDSSNLSFNVGADVVSRYIWRGQANSASPAIQPTLGITYKGLSLGSWASYTFTDADLQEVDLFLTYEIGGLTVGLNDYFMPSDSAPNNKYFNWKKKETGHTLEPFVTYSEIAGTPLSLTAAVFAYGDDLDENEDNYYSSYLELSYAKTLGDIDYNIFCGGTFGEGYYADDMNIVNIGITLTKTIEITPTFSLPCNGSFIINPNTENVFFVFGITF
jgi:hypothetical protein